MGLGRLLKIGTLDVSFGCRIVHPSDSSCISEGILGSGFTAISGFVGICFCLFLGVQEGRRLFVDRAGKSSFQVQFLSTLAGFHVIFKGFGWVVDLLKLQSVLRY